MSRHLARAAAGLTLRFLTTPVAQAQDDAALYRRDCAARHDSGVDRAPRRDALQGMSAERVLTTMESGPSGASSLSSSAKNPCQRATLLTVLAAAGIPQEKLGDSTGRLEPDLLSLG